MKNDRTGRNYVEPLDDSRMEGSKAERTDADSTYRNGRQNDDLKYEDAELYDMESAESWRYLEVKPASAP